MFREDLFQEIFNHPIPNTRAETVEYKFLLFSLFLYVLKTKLCLKNSFLRDKHIRWTKYIALNLQWDFKLLHVVYLYVCMVMSRS